MNAPKKRLHREQHECGWFGRWRNTAKRAAQDRHDHLQSCPLASAVSR